MRPSFRTFFIAVLIPWMLIGCSQNKKITPVNPEFAAYVSDYTQGLIPIDAPINLTLSIDPKLMTEPGSEVKEQIFSFDPQVKGKAFWVDGQTIRFIPAQTWPRDRQIEVSFFLNKLLDVPSTFHIFRYHLQTLPLSFELVEVALSLPEGYGNSYYQLKGRILTSEKISPEKTNGLLKIIGKGVNYKVQIRFDESMQALVFVADSIERKEESYPLQIQWDGSVVESNQKGEMKIEVPAKGVFAMTNIVVTDLPEQAIHLWFSDEPDPTQNLSGLFNLTPRVAVKMDVLRNEIIVYPQEVVDGESELVISAGLRSKTGQILSEDTRQNISFDQMKPQVKFVGKSTILSGDQNGILTFQAVSLRAVDVHVVKIFENNMLQFLQWNNLDGQDDLKRVGRIIARQQVVLQPENSSNMSIWQTYSVDLSKLIKQDKGALYRVYFTFKKEYALWDCAKKSTFKKETYTLSKEELAKWGDGSYYDPTFSYPDNFSWYNRNNPCDDSYYYSDHFPGRNFLLSNIGMMVMESNLATNEYLFVVNNLVTTVPVGAAKVDLFDFQQQLIASGTTNAQGMVKLNTGLINPAVAVATIGNERAYVKLQQGAAHSYSRFDVEGEKLQGSMKGFVFTERGVYRPGDTLFIGFILKNEGEVLPADYPVVLELTNARFQMVERQTQNKLKDGMCLFRVPTASDAPTGVWKTTIKAGSAVFEKRIWVEAIKPNRLKINFDFGKTDIPREEANRKVQLKVNWLHGAKAANMDVVMERSLLASELKLRVFPSYTFNDLSLEPMRIMKSETRGKTDAQGFWNTDLNLSDLKINASKVKVQWSARVTEPGGDFSTSTFSADYYPFDSFLGLDSPEPTTQGYLETDRQLSFNIISVNRNGELRGNGNLKAEVYKLNWNWWWMAEGDGVADYSATYGKELFFTKELSLNAGKAVFNWTPKYPLWGTFLVKISRPEGGHSVSKVVYLDWPDSYSRSGRDLRGGANLLTMSTDKEKYQTGETAVVSFIGPGKGRALVSIEKGSRQLTSWWIETVEGENKVVLPLTAVHSPNIYVHITLLQPTNQVKNDMPIRSYGVASLEVEGKNSRVKPVLQLDQEVKTGQNFTIKVNENKGQPMTYLLAVVDEGLLDLTNHATPEPHGYFYAKEALGLKTWDMYDFVLGAYGGKIEQLFTIGGDAALPDREKARQSRFVPVVKVLGPFQLKAGETKSHVMSVENYIGSVRVMVVAVSGLAFGSADATIKVKQPLMVLGTLPRLLRQKDEVVMPVTVFSGLKGRHEVKLLLRTSGTLKNDGLAEKTITFEGPDEQTTYFRLKASSVEGLAQVEIKATSGAESASQKIEMSVENPNTRVFERKSVLLEQGQKMTEMLQLPGDPSTHLASIEISTLPAVNLKSRLEELLLYPHGCTEQITSQAFAQLYLDKVLQLSTPELEQQQQNIQSAIRQIVSRQSPDGSIPYWPGGSYRNEWSEIFAGHFMVLAARENKAVPAMSLSLWAKNQRNKASAWFPEQHHRKDQLSNDHLQAYRLYVLALQGEPLMSAMNRLREHPLLSKTAAQTLAAAYAVAGQKEAARELALGNKSRPENNYGDMTFSSNTRDMAMKLETFLLLEEKNLAFPLLESIGKVLSSDVWLSTQETAYSLYAYQLYASTFNQKAPASFVLTQVDPTKHSLVKTMFSVALAPKPEKVTVENTGEQPLFVSISTSGILSVGDFLEKESGISIKLSFSDEKGTAVDVSQLTQGTTFSMNVVVENKSEKALNFMALNQVIPAGWEIINDRMNAMATKTDFKSNYTDIRDDRLVHYFDLPKGQSRSFSTTVIATYEGKFLLPSVHCEAMYDHNISASRGGGWSVISRNKE